MYANSNRFFDGIKTVEDVKKLYRKLAMIHHPDRGGDLATMQRLNAEYEQALKACHGQVNTGDDGKEHTYAYNADVEQQIVEFIDKIIRSGVIEKGCEVYLIGTWVWIMGDTKPSKDILKELGCKWHSKRVCWYFTAEERRHFYSKEGLNGLAARYGASKVAGRKPEERTAIGD